jgi:hypothetical protein
MEQFEDQRIQVQVQSGGGREKVCLLSRKVVRYIRCQHSLEIS